MKICSNCGKEYLTKVCVRCRNKEEKKQKNNNLSEKDKLFKTIRYVIIIFIGLLVIGMIAELLITSYIIKSAEPTINNMNEMTKDMVEQNKKLMKKLERGFR